MEHRVKLVEDVDEATKRYVMARDCEIGHDSDDTIRWKNTTDTTYLIHFENSPFEGNDFLVPAHREKASPPLRKGIALGFYPYLIKRPASAEMAADPNVIVR